MSRVAVVSFRLGGTDGVSIEAVKWVGALRHLGHHVTTVAGSGSADRIIAGLAADAQRAPALGDVRDALKSCDLVIVENLASLPLNVAARDVLYEVLAGRDALFHHHDLAWQRVTLAHLEGPRDDVRWEHVTINELSRRELLARGITATTLYNSFDCDPPLGRRDQTRRGLGVSEQRLVALPTRAIARKNIPGALALCEELGATLWIMGPAEDGYGDELDELLAASRAPVIREVPHGVTMSDAYSAADLVVMSSTWEGFGNPVIESVTHRRPLALNPYPVAREITSFGFEFFDLHDVAGIEDFLVAPDQALFESNIAVARQHFNLTHLPKHLEEILSRFSIHRDD
ncbi:MAG TPA: hypothetical protein VIJ86_03930 [Acidimicrobiales bacterium]